MVPGVIGEVSERDLFTLVVARVGCLEETGSPWGPYRLVDPSGAGVRPVARFLAELQAVGRAGGKEGCFRRGGTEAEQGDREGVARPDLRAGNCGAWRERAAGVL